MKLVENASPHPLPFLPDYFKATLWDRKRDDLTEREKDRERKGEGRGGLLFSLFVCCSQNKSKTRNKASDMNSTHNKSAAAHAVKT